jgi:oligopeptide transport system ATP-binding protein
VSGAALLEVEDLAVSFRTDMGTVPAVNGVSFRLEAGETLALVGESGSGKSVTSLAIMGLTPGPRSCTVRGKVRFRGRDGEVRDLLAVPESEMRGIRGDQISMIFQEPMTSLNPVHTIGDQIAETVMQHRKADRASALGAARELLELVGIPDSKRRLASYPHHLSGGMRQRAMIAMALACHPSVLIADEPTTALDVTIQAQILELLRKLQQETGMSIIFITHNLGVVAEIADRVMVMYAGRVVEQADVVALFKEPLMPYTMGLLNSVPRVEFAEESRRALAAIPGNVPDPMRLPPGCSFHPRCDHFAQGLCDQAIPDLDEAPSGHLVRCRRWRELHPGAA